MTRISVVGAGHVGLVTAACFARLGHTVTCLDIDKERIDCLRDGRLPIYEPGLAAVIREGMAARLLDFSLAPQDCVPESDFVIVAVQTPADSNGQADLTALFEAIRSLAGLLHERAVIVQKSTAPVGTTLLLEQFIHQRVGSPASVVANPEFLREGAAIQDFFHPHRVVVGATDRGAAARVADLYAFADCPLVITDPSTAEMIKYASNAFLAARLSFVNEIARICDNLGIDIRQVTRGMGYDPRIGPEFLGAGIGWGGSCLPKDVKALIHMAQSAGVSSDLLESVQRVNSEQQQQVLAKLTDFLGDLNGAVIGLLGLAFKPDTDDLRESPALKLAQALLDRGAHVRAYDPVAMSKACKVMPAFTCCKGPVQVASGADALVLVTDWPQFRELNMAALKRRMRRPVLIDGRNFWERAAMESLGFLYSGFGVGSTARKIYLNRDSLHLAGPLA